MKSAEISAACERIASETPMSTAGMRLTSTLSPCRERCCPILSIPVDLTLFVGPVTIVNISIILAHSSNGIASPMARAAVRLPAHNPFKFCALCMDVRHDDHGPPRFKQCPFDDGYFLGVIGHGLTDHGEIQTAGRAAKRVADLPHRHVYHLRLSGDAGLLCNCFKASCGFIR